MQSKMDSSISLTETNWAITLVRHDQHAIIIWEKIVDDCYELWRADLIKAGDSTCPEDYTHKNYSFLDKKDYPGEVRKGQVSNGENMTKKDIYTKFHLTQGIIYWVGETWECSSANTASMERSINADRASPPRFHISGKSFNVKGAHNCITWAEEKLSMAGISLQHSTCGDSIEGLLSRAITSLRV